MTVNYDAVLGAAVASFVVGGLWYSPLLFGNVYLTLRGLDPTAQSATSAWEMAGELVRCVVLAIVLAQVLSRSDAFTVGPAVGLAGWFWVGIYATLAGSVLHEGTPWRLYLLHAGDGFAKLMVSALILARWAR